MRRIRPASLGAGPDRPSSPPCTRSTAALLAGLLAGCAGAPGDLALVEDRGVVVDRAREPRVATPAPERAHGVNRRMASVAEEMVGVRYHYSGSSPGDGFDCSGLIQYAYRRIGQRVPRTTEDLYRHARPVRRSEIRVGDLLFFVLDGETVSHVAVYLGDGRMVHASSGGGRVAYARLGAPYWRSRFVAARRIG